ncbi:160L [Cherax quadricarinatus iridovirus]|uniref:160L n=1 Tax=Cherax quadricarinatus iridovirus TaxID=2035708 RepID=UPI000BC09F3B|nr:160L [Cherax quadricarinatus iridovirus]UPA43304.1 160L [Iridovirus CN01]ASZ85140.1 160L [Cherax quadricarinatus iridovirus]UPA43539.1 160L [Iridovirus CN01]UPA43736.1 160L [Iridovirus CN01]UPA43897.1 160L [Iridovirus CN01]
MYKNSNVNMSIRYKTHGSSYDPESFGPAFWFTLHNGVTAYPDKPTKYIQGEMIKLISALHVLIPCAKCKEHFYTYISSTDLNKITSSRENLFEFFVNVHNFVNKRNFKPQMSLQDAKRLYGFNDRTHGSSVYITYE